MTREPFLPYLWMLIGSLAFALMGILAHVLGDACDWQVIAIARSSSALVFAGLLVPAAGARFVFWTPRTLWVRSLAGSVSMVCTFYAFTRLPVSEVLVLTNTFPIWVALLSWPLLGEAPTRAVWFSIGSGVLGVILIQQPHFAEGNFTTLLALGSSFATAIAMLGLHRLQGIDARAIVVHFSGVALVFCVGSFFLFEHPGRLAVLGNGALLWGLLGVGATATIGQLLLTRAFAAGPPAKVSVVGLTQIVFAMVLELVLWRRSFNLLTLLGIGLVMAPTGWLLAHGASARRRAAIAEQLWEAEPEQVGVGGPSAE